LKTDTHNFSQKLKITRILCAVLLAILFIIALFFFSCSDYSSEYANKNKMPHDTLLPPASILIKNPITVNLDTCPAPYIQVLSTKKITRTILLKNGKLLNLEPPFAQPADFLSLMKNYTSDEGLPIDMVFCSTIDRKGNIWFGTGGGGISRYDGKSFTNFNITQGLANDAVWSVVQDKQENIWMGTYGGGVSCYNGKSFMNFNTSNGLVNNFVLSILQDTKGNLWFGTLHGLSRYDGKSFFNYTNEQGLANNCVWSILEDKKGNLWFGTNEGALCYDGKSFTNITTSQGLVNNTVRSIAEDKKGNFWFATEGGVSCYRHGVFINYTVAHGLAGNNVRSIIEDKKGNLWFGTFNGGVSFFNGKTFTNFTTKQGLINNQVVNIAEDKTGNIWINSMAGVSCYKGPSFINFTNAQGLSHNFVYGIAEDKKGNLWLNTNKSGMVCYDGKNFTNYTDLQGFPESPSTFTIEDTKGDLWFGTYTRGLSCFDGKSVTTYTTQQGLISNCIVGGLMDKKRNLWFASLGGGVSRYDGKSFVSYTSSQGLANNFVTCIIEDHSGKLWLGTEGGGVSCYNETVFTNYSTAQGLANNNVRGMIEDKSGNIWIGTDVGVSRYDGKTFLNYSSVNGLPDENVPQLAITHEQNLVIGTNKGIALMTSFTKKILDKKLPERIPVQNNLTNEQLKRYAPVFEIYNSATGYPVKDVNSGQGTLYKDHMGMLWIATGSDKTALVRFDYSALQKDTTLPVVLIQNIKINGETICWSDLRKPNQVKKDEHTGNGNMTVPANITEEVSSFGRILSDTERDTLCQKFSDIQFDSTTRFYPIPQNLILPFKKNNITFDFTAIEPAEPYLVRYQYQLEGYDEEWNPVTTKTTATFGNIDEGTYIFKLKAQGPSGLWSVPIAYVFKILPPWWRTWWMYAIYGALIIGLVLLIVWRNGRRLRGRAIQLALEVKKATQEIEAQKKIVEEKNKDIMDSINYALRIQKAFLPKKEQFYLNLPKSFILFKPKDIVSGDFYFFHKTFSIKENTDAGLLFIAAVDCTGHGVPGAFLSMVGSERLTDAVQQSDNASEILSLLNKGVKNSLHQTAEDESTRDGMDIAICSVDVKHRIVKYAGANRPLWLIRKGKNEMEEIKSTKVAVGGLTEDDQHFESHELKLSEGDTFYIFSDGYADIFSGESGKKLTTKKFKQILLDIQDKTMQEQEHYLDHFIEKWKAGTEQIDDILVIGIRF
jgi:ligand-binding sensor domain-containing protein/serine phosphatase RsbU (regulator of sigma subunit)